MLPWDDLRFVLAMSRGGSATAAGRELGVNATTVTRRIQALEDHLGVRLFDRRSTGMVATDAGEAAVQVALRMEDEVYGLDAEIRGLDRELRGSLRISSLDIVFELWRADLLELQQQLPRVELVLLDQTHVVDLARREADVAIRFAIAPPEHLVGRRHVELFYAVYASAQLVERVTDGGARTARYADYPWIGWDGMFAAATDRVVQQHAPGAAIPLRINSLALLGRSIEDGIGVSVMPCFYGDRQPGLVRLGDYFEGGMYFWVLTHEQLRRTARVRAFTDFVARLIERDRPLFLGRSPAAPTVAVATS